MRVRASIATSPPEERVTRVINTYREHVARNKEGFIGYGDFVRTGFPWQKDIRSRADARARGRAIQIIRALYETSWEEIRIYIYASL